MNVPNRSCIRRLSLRTLRMSRRRNCIAIFAIALTAMLFTALFTIALSINETYQTYTFRQIGGYAHGTFKEVTPEQIEAISAHPLVRQAGVRRVAGYIWDGVFAKKSAEISYMDPNCARWSYAVPTTGRMPESGLELAADTGALALLGITPELGAQVPLTFQLGDQVQTGQERTEVFTLVGFWPEDPLLPVHYLNVSEDYVNYVDSMLVEAGMEPGRADLNVMMRSSVNIAGQMERVDTDLGYPWEDRNAENAARIDVNWGYTTAQLGEQMNAEETLSIAAILLLIGTSGYLIIYNIFQISAHSDIRYYGLLKAIGVTPRQLRRIIRYQAYLLGLAGVPAGLLAGFGIGAALFPVISSSLSNDSLLGARISFSPWIFAFAALFSFATVRISCAKPGRFTSKVSPVQATRYVGGSEGGGRRMRRRKRGAGILSMALANLGRDRRKTVLVFLSLALSVVLLNLLVTFVGGFDEERYLGARSCADFLVSTPGYFRYAHGETEYLSERTIEEIAEGTKQSLSGCGYKLSSIYRPQVWIPMERWTGMVGDFGSYMSIDELLASHETKGDLVQENAMVEGLDEELFSKLTVLSGSLDAVTGEGAQGIAVVVLTDDYGNPMNLGSYPELGETVTVTYIRDLYYIDTRTGEPADDATTAEFARYEITDASEAEYVVAALVTRPHAMGFRYYTLGYDLILPRERLEADSEMEVAPMFYLFDTPDAEAEDAAEAFLSRLSEEREDLMYESKALLRAEFTGFQRMFALVGGVLCAVVALIGALNFLNAVLTGILTRGREFATLQAVGMTKSQLLKMLIEEGLLYTLGAAALALAFSIAFYPALSRAMQGMFWFVSPHRTVLPVLLAVPVFLLLGMLIPALAYRRSAKKSIVERLREIG